MCRAYLQLNVLFSVFPQWHMIGCCWPRCVQIGYVKKCYVVTGIQHREVAIGRSREKEDQARVRAEREASRSSEENVICLIRLLFTSMSISVILYVSVSACMYGSILL